MLREGWDVLGVDNFCTGRRRNLSYCNAYPRFEFVERDAIEPFEVEGPLDWVFHMASPASPPMIVPLKRMYCRSRPAFTSMIEISSFMSQEST